MKKSILVPCMELKRAKNLFGIGVFNAVNEFCTEISRIEGKLSIALTIDAADAEIETIFSQMSDLLIRDSLALNEYYVGQGYSPTINIASPYITDSQFNSLCDDMSAAADRLKSALIADGRVRIGVEVDDFGVDDTTRLARLVKALQVANM